jgi:hypothetical protein
MIGSAKLQSPFCQGLRLQPKMSHSEQTQRFLDVLGRRIELAAKKVKKDAKPLLGVGKTRNYRLDAQLLQQIGPRAIQVMLREPGVLTAFKSYSVEVKDIIQPDDFSIQLTILVKSRN